MSDLIAALAPSARALPESGIVKVFNYGRNREGLIAMWAGEGDTPTPELIRAAANSGAGRGQTFYTYQRGIPPLREALAAYFAAALRAPFLAPRSSSSPAAACRPSRWRCNSSSARATRWSSRRPAGPISPARSCRAAACRVSRPCSSAPRAGRSISTACSTPVTARTRAHVHQLAVEPDRLDRQSRTNCAPSSPSPARAGLWIIADEIYGRYHYEGGVAPSFQTLREPDDRIVFVPDILEELGDDRLAHGLAASPARTGADHRESHPVQHLGRADFPAAGGRRRAHRGRSRWRAPQIARAAEGRQHRVLGHRAFRQCPLRLAGGRVLPAVRHRGRERTRSTPRCKLVDEANIGLAPGIAFGPEGEGFFRICYQRSPDQLREAMARLATWL